MKEERKTTTKGGYQTTKGMNPGRQAIYKHCNQYANAMQAARNGKQKKRSQPHKSRVDPGHGSS